MKKIIIYFNLFILFLTASSNAQTYYSHYLDGTSEWRYYTTGDQQFYLTKIYRTIFFDGTEDYDGYTYYRERFFTVYKYYDINTFDFISEDDYYPTIYNLIREDEQGRFYRRPYFDYSVEEMYQDNIPIQNSQIGDIFPSLPDFNFGTCPIISIQNINIDTLSLKWLKGYLGNYGGLVEGIGPVAQGCDGGNGGGLVCYTKQGTSLMFLPDLGDCTIFPEPVRLSNENFVNNLINIYPNPTNNIINIVCNDAIEQLNLFDLQGRNLQIATNTVSIDLSLLPKGVYLLTIKTDKTFQTQKIIKN